VGVIDGVRVGVCVTVGVYVGPTQNVRPGSGNRPVHSSVCVVAHSLVRVRVQ